MSMFQASGRGSQHMVAKAETMLDFASNQQNRCFHRLSTHDPYPLLPEYVGR